MAADSRSRDVAAEPVDAGAAFVHQAAAQHLLEAQAEPAETLACGDSLVLRQRLQVIDGNFTAFLEDRCDDRGDFLIWSNRP